MRLGSVWTDEPFPTISGRAIHEKVERRWIDQVFPRIRRLTRLLPVSRLSIGSILDFHLLIVTNTNK